MYEIEIPFSGFYHSVHSDEINREIEQLPDYFEWTEYDIPESLMNLFWDAANHSAAYEEYAQEYVESFCAEYLPDAEFSGMSSPREYNFSTDRVFAKIPRSTVAMLWRKTNKAIFAQIVEERFTSRDGFISHYSPDWQTWGKLSEWDHSQLGTLLLAYLVTIHDVDWDQWLEHELMESYLCNGGVSSALWQGDKAKRAWRIYDYLRERSGRKVKTMAQWRVAFAKTWESTPLGGFGS